MLDKFREKHRILFIFIIITILLIIILFGAKLYLVFNFIIGNDVSVKLSVDHESTSLNNKQSADISFTASATANPFCKIECSSTFFDISNNQVLNYENFSLFSTLPLSKTYSVRSGEKGYGQKLYRYTMQCHSIRTNLCHTTEIPTTRTALITVDYDLSDEDKEKQQKLKTEIERIKADVEELNSRAINLNMTIASLKYLQIKNPDNFTYILESTRNITNNLNGLKYDWENYNFDFLSSSIDTQKQSITQVNNNINDIVLSVNKEMQTYNNILRQINQSKGTLDYLNEYTYNNNTDAEIKQNINKLNIIIDSFKKNASIDSKKTLFFDLEKLNNQIEKLKSNTDKKMIERYGGLLKDYETLCKISGYCYKNQSLMNISNPDYNYICTKIDELNTTTQYLITDTNTSLDTNYTLLQEFANTLDYSCFNTNKSSIQGINTSPAVFVFEDHYVLDFALEQPKSECCIMGKCDECCVDDECKYNPNNYPIVFLHGHAFNKDLSAEYSLDAFNPLQDRLEDLGYINAGTISLYTDPSNTNWDKIDSPLSIKASYYYDIFHEPENYVITQANSENIETYAIRLKELIDIIQAKTGRPKVNIIAHSMGGLVTRRYIQLFGEDKIDKIIFITVPHRGIEGSVADYCPLLGETKECEDMSANSTFIKKLNAGTLPTTKVHNIIGIGCYNNDKESDGVVLKSNAKIDPFQNYYVQGTCGTIKTMHEEILNINKYPKVYSIIEQVLKE